MERLDSQISDQMKRINIALDLLKQQRHSKVTPVKAFKMKQVAYYERQAVLADTSEWSDFPGGIIGEVKISIVVFRQRLFCLRTLRERLQP